MSFKACSVGGLKFTTECASLFLFFSFHSIHYTRTFPINEL